MGISPISFKFFSDLDPPRINEVQGGKDNPNKFLSGYLEKIPTLILHHSTNDFVSLCKVMFFFSRKRMFLPFYVGLEHNYQGCALPLSYGGITTIYRDIS